MPDPDLVPAHLLPHTHDCAHHTHGGTCTCTVEARHLLQQAAWDDLAARGRQFRRGLLYPQQTAEGDDG